MTKMNSEADHDEDRHPLTDMRQPESSADSDKKNADTSFYIRIYRSWIRSTHTELHNNSVCLQ